MLRSLARVYYYFVFIAMLILAAVGLGILLAQVLRYTPLNAGGSLPTGAEMAQALSIAAVFWAIAGILGGVHYVLLRRDLASDPMAGAGGVRSFFLNSAEFVAGWVGVGFASGALAQIGDPVVAGEFAVPSPVVLFLAIALAAYALVAVVELERRRTQAGSGAPIVFQRLNVYAIQFIVVFYLLSALAGAIGRTLQVTLYPTNTDTCAFIGTNPQACPSPNLLGPWLSAAFLVALLAGYYLLTRNDRRSVLRQVQQLLAVATGAVPLAVGVGNVLTALFSDQFGPFTVTTYLPLTLASLLVVAAYALVLRAESRDSAMGPATAPLAVEAVFALVFAVPFWLGVFLILQRVIEILFNPTFVDSSNGWASPLAILLTGALYIPVGLALRFQSRASGANGPRRAFVLALLALGTLTGAIGGAVALVTTITAALGAPLDTSGASTRIGVALFLTGLALAGFYGWSVVSEHLLGSRASQNEQSTDPDLPAVLPPRSESVETILDELLAGQVTREQAASRVREAVRAGR